MKILFVTQYDEIHSSIILKMLVESGYKIIGVVTSKTLIHKKNLVMSITDIIKKSGMRYFFMRALEGIYIKFYGKFKMVGYDRFKKYSPVKIKEIIRRYNLKHFPVEDINSDKSLELIKGLFPDVIICCVFNQIFKKGILEIPKYGCINIHRSLLPAYRGVSPSFWVLANNEKFTGITLHYMTEKIDFGRIVAQKKVDIRKDDTVNTLSFRLMNEGAKLLKEVLEKIESRQKLQKIDIKEDSKYYGWPTKEAVKRFIKNKKKIF